MSSTLTPGHGVRGPPVSEDGAGGDGGSLAALLSSFPAGMWLEEGGHRQKDFLLQTALWPVLTKGKQLSLKHFYVCACRQKATGFSSNGCAGGKEKPNRLMAVPLLGRPSSRPPQASISELCSHWWWSGGVRGASVWAGLSQVRSACDRRSGPLPVLLIPYPDQVTEE